MPMPVGAGWIVDASNVVGSRPDRWWRDRPGALLRLLDEIACWRIEVGDEVLVVADGFPTPRAPEGEIYGVRLRYALSTARDAADDEIVRVIQAHAAAAELTVVTSDRALRERVTGLGARVEGSGRFLDRLADIEVRRSDRAVLAHFGISERAFLGRGGEASVFALDDERVLRIPHLGERTARLEERRRMLVAIADPDVVRTPEVLEHVEIAGRVAVIERRLPGRNAAEVLAERNTDRAALVRHHLDVTFRLVDLPFPGTAFGELWDDGAIQAATFAEWSEARLAASLRGGGQAFDGISSSALTQALVDALPEPEPPLPLLVHLDAFLGNMLADDSRITAVLDFGPMTIGGPPHLDALVAIAYLAPEITPHADDGDRDVARRWAADAGLAKALEPAERWIAAYWAGAVDDRRLASWCRRILRR